MKPLLKTGLLNILPTLMTFLLFPLIMCANTNVKADTTHKVLLLNSYHPQYKWTQQITQGVQDTFATSISAENLYIEYMDARHYIDDKEYETQLKKLIAYKYSKRHPDIIITSDDHAFNFMVEHGDTLFPGKPVVFNGVNVFNQATLEGKNNFTGILEGMAIEENIALITQVQPQVKRIILLGDTTGLGSRMVQHARQLQMNWQGDPEKQGVKLEIMDRFTLDQLYSFTETLNKDTAILMLAIHKDRVGNYFSFEHELPILSKHSRVPIYGMWGGLMIGNGILGGVVNDPYLHGQRAANMALLVLSGESPKNIPIQEKSIFKPEFDFNQLQRFKITSGMLPENSIVRNKPMTLYEKYQRTINGVVAFFIFLMVVIAVLVENIKQRDVAKKQLAKLNRDLEHKINQRTMDLKDRNSELESINERMEKMAHTDVLTGLGNRRAANSEIESYVNRSSISHEKFSIAILDVDFFKRVNDTFGHQAGDDVLFHVSQIIKHALRPSDRVYRWGGEEFLIALPNTNEQFSTAVCQRVRNNINQYEHGLVGQVTASIGVTTLLETDSISSLIQRCDEHLYFAKENGRDQVISMIN